MVKLHEYNAGKKIVEVHQLLAGREFAKKHDDPQIQSIFNSAKSSANFVYCIVVKDAKNDAKGPKSDPQKDYQSRAFFEKKQTQNRPWAPTWPQDGAKRVPRRSKPRFWTIFDRFSVIC